MRDMGGGGQEKKMTKCDKGEGVKNSDFRSDVLFEWPLTRGGHAVSIGQYPY